MIDWYVLGFIGIFIASAGFLLMIVGGIRFITTEKFDFLLLGFIATFLGGYFRYLSKQTHQGYELGKDNSKNNDQVQNTKKTLSKYSGVRDIGNDTYQLYLVEEYKIEKNKTLGKFVFNKKLYENLEDALQEAHEFDLQNYKKGL